MFPWTALMNLSWKSDSTDWDSLHLSWESPRWSSTYRWCWTLILLRGCLDQSDVKDLRICWISRSYQSNLCCPVVWGMGCITTRRFRFCHGQSLAWMIRLVSGLKLWCVTSCPRVSTYKIVTPETDIFTRNSSSNRIFHIMETRRRVSAPVWL